MVGQLYRSHTAPTTTQVAPIYTLASRSPVPEVVYIHTIAELDTALQGFNGPYGFDCEWKCMPRDSRVALVQLSNGSKVLLVQVSAMPEFPARLKTILEDPSVVKVGHAIEGDGARLRDDHGVNAQNLYNIAPIAMRVDPTFKQKFSTWRFLTVAHIVEYFLKRTLPKGPVRTSNWERVPLTEAQREYAAGDAHCVYEIYTLLLARAASFGPTLQGYGKIAPRDFNKGSFMDSFPIDRYDWPPGLGRNEVGAYTMWYQGYHTGDIQATMARHCRSPPNDDEGVISLVVRALKQKSTLPYDATALRALVQGSLAAYNEHKAFIEERCPITSHSDCKAEASSAASGSARSSPERDLATTHGPSSQQAGASKRIREDEERESTPEETLPSRPGKRMASSPEPEEHAAVKRSRTTTF